MKKRLLITAIIILMVTIFITSCSSESKSKLNSKKEGSRVVFVGIEYKKGLLTGSSNKTEAKVYIDDIEVDEINRGEKKAYATCLEPGTHTVVVKRTKKDVSEYKFDVEKVSDEDIFWEKFVGLSYEYISGFGKTNLESAKFPDVVDEDYIWFYDGDQASIGAKKSSEVEEEETQLLELTDVFNNREVDFSEAVNTLEAQDFSFEYNSDESIYYDQEREVAVGELEDLNSCLVLSSNPRVTVFGISPGDSIKDTVDYLNEIGEQNYDITDNKLENVSWYNVKTFIVYLASEGSSVDRVGLLINNIYTETESNDDVGDDLSEFETEEYDVPEEDYFVFPDSSERYISEEELVNLGQKDIRIAKNEIYARHGRKFKDEDLQRYFESLPWYEGTIDSDVFDEALFNDFEKFNIELFSKYE